MEIIILSEVSQLRKRNVTRFLSYVRIDTNTSINIYTYIQSNYPTLELLEATK
jgi:hypothetical protein